MELRLPTRLAVLLLSPNTSMAEPSTTRTAHISTVCRRESPRIIRTVTSASDAREWVGRAAVE